MPSVFGIPVPTLMLIGGVALGILLALCCRVLVRFTPGAAPRSADQAAPRRRSARCRRRAGRRADRGRAGGLRRGPATASDACAAAGPVSVHRRRLGGVSPQAPAERRPGCRRPSAALSPTSTPIRTRRTDERDLLITFRAGWATTWRPRQAGDAPSPASGSAPPRGASSASSGPGSTVTPTWYTVNAWRGLAEHCLASLRAATRWSSTGPARPDVEGHRGTSARRSCRRVLRRPRPEQGHQHVHRGPRPRPTTPRCASSTRRSGPVAAGQQRGR